MLRFFLQIPERQLALVARLGGRLRSGRLAFLGPGCGQGRLLRLGIAAHAPPAALTLLSISFQETDPPAGQIFLTFAENVVIRLDVECLEAQLRDLGPRRAAEQPPSRDKTRASTSDAR